MTDRPGTFDEARSSGGGPRGPPPAGGPPHPRDGVPRVERVSAVRTATGVGSAGISLYVHIPFCASRCPYCDFATAPATSALRARYLAALNTEIGREGAALGRPRVRTLYVGGGTPSLLEPDEVSALATALGASFDLALVEATVEANPATLDRARLEAWAALGITRLSLGAQSFSERGLRELGRTHQPQDVVPAIDAGRTLGLAVGLDLIFGWPEQSLDEWLADLGAAIALRPDHISCYPLELVLEPEEAVANWPGGGWPTVRRWRERAAKLQPGDETVARMYRSAERVLRNAGFQHYEIANWAGAGKRCEHNLVYWRNGEWLGLGAGAHSHLAGARSRRPATLLTYLEAIAGDGARIADPAADEASDTAMLALRLDDGLDLGTYAGRFGGGAARRVRAALGRSTNLGLVRWSGEVARLTPRGRLLANEVFVDLIADDVSTSPGALAASS
jgi:oxygen-independent coproporphyrinogen-3 oxidase